MTDIIERIEAHRANEGALSLAHTAADEIRRLRDMIGAGNAAAYEESMAAKDTEIARLRAQVEAMTEELRRHLVFPALQLTNGYCSYCLARWTQNEPERHYEKCLLTIPAIPPEPPGGE